MRGMLPGKTVNAQEAGLKKGKPAAKKAAPEAEEAELLFDKTYICPVCEREFTSKTVRSGKAFPDRMDIDLRSRYKNIEPIKYRVVGCIRCHYAALDVDFSSPLKREADAFRDSSSEISLDANCLEGVRSFRDALLLLRAALSISLIKGSKNSERAGIALQTAWLLRSMGEQQVKTEPEETKPEEKNAVSFAEMERKYLRYALQYFVKARQLEDFPIRGMDEGTFDYLLAALCYETGQPREAHGYVTKALRNREMNRKLRRMAEDLLAELRSS